jgi:hypothetical protein
MTVLLSPVGGAAAQFFDNNGKPLTGGKLFTYAAGSTVPEATFTSSLGNTAHTNPIILDAAGRVSGGEIWLTGVTSYKFALYTSTDVLIAIWDNIVGISNATNASEIAFTGFKGQTGTVQDLADDDGSDWVGFEPSTVGSVARSVQEKLRDGAVSVKDYGAIGDGVANDTAAIVAALAANNAIFFPAGEYLVSGNINIQNKTLIGNSWRDTVIQLVGINTNTPVFINSANSGSPWGSGGGFTLNHLTVKGNWDGVTANPVSINNFDNLGSIVRWYAGSYVNVTDCWIQDSFGHGLAFERLGYSYIQFNHIFVNKYNGIHLFGPSGSESVTSTWVSDNSIHSCRGISCIYLQNGLTMIATQNILEDAENGFYVDGNDNRGVSFCFNDIEQMSNSGVYLEGNGSSFSISNNFLGVTTPITIGSGGAEFKQGVFTNNAFSNVDYVTFMPTIGSGSTFDTPMNFFGKAQNGSGTGKIGWRSNNNNDAGIPEVEIVGVHSGNVNERGGALLIRTSDPSTGVLSDRVLIDQVGNIYPAVDNTQTLGAASNRWSVVYAGTGTINTSDADTKQDVRGLLDSEKVAAVEMKSLLKAYRFKDAVEVKGDGARIHFGAIAQDVAAVFEKHGLNPNRYGLFCSDTWYEYQGTPVKVDEDKKYVTIHYELNGVAVDAGLDGKLPEGSVEVIEKFDTVERTRLGLRYDELFAFIIAAI